MLERLYIEQSVWDTEEADRLRKALSRLPCERVADGAEVYRRVAMAADPVSEGKRVLLCTENRGRFLRPCPGTRNYTCCGYWIVHTGTYCTMDCSYCILQGYFHPPVLQYFLNRRDLFSQLEKLARHKPSRMRRLGTGEFTDSLIWEPWDPLARELATWFGTQRHGVLELKTKTVNIAGFQDVVHNRKTIMAWSINTPTVIAGQERGTAPLEARLEAAARCASWGYPLAFHFDPMVLYPGCEAEYIAVVEAIFRKVRPEDVVWVSLGTFRFMPHLKPVIERRFPESRIVYGEFVSGMDGKMRYFQPLRLRLYRSVAQALREVSPELCVYFCMENDKIWREALGFVPDQRGGLPRMLDESAASHCDLS